MSSLPSILSIPVLAVLVAVPPTSYRHSYSTFREEAGGLSVFADGFPATLAADGAYVPVPIAVALMRNGASVTFTPESFTLTDAAGNRVPAAGYTELKNGYPRLDFDRVLMRRLPMSVGMAIGERPRIASNFYPPTGAGTRIPSVELAPFSWFTDVIYFPRPPGGLGGVMTLSVAVGGADPIELKFLTDPGALAKR